MGNTSVVACFFFICFFLYFIVSFFSSYSFISLLDRKEAKFFWKGPKGSRRAWKFSILRRRSGQIFRKVAPISLLLSRIKIKKKHKLKFSHFKISTSRHFFLIFQYKTLWFFSEKFSKISVSRWLGEHM